MSENNDPLTEPLWPRMVLPTEPRKVRETLRRYERKLRKQKEEHGFISDGAGSRYLIGPLYLLMEDLDGAAAAFAWFEEEFPDDWGEPGHRLCWALSHHRSGNPDAASKLRQAMLANLYLLPRLLGDEVGRLDIWHSSSDEQPWYPEILPIQYFTMWSDEELAWAGALYRSEEFTTARERTIEIYRELLQLAPGPRRSSLVEEAFRLQQGGDV